MNDLHLTMLPLESALSSGVVPQPQSSRKSSPDSPDACPACRHPASQPLETIHLAQQHSSYSGDAATQQALTTAAEIPGNAYRMLKCASCGLEFAHPQQAPTARWYELVYQVLALYPARRWEFDYILPTLRPQDTVGEIGCGSGEFLKRCRDAGLQASGVDFSTTAVAACLASGLDAHVLDLTGTVPDFMTGRDRHVLVAFQVLEHLDDPGSLFALAAQWSAPAAKLWVAVPSNRRPSRLFGEEDYLDQPPHHMARWTELALAAIAQQTGWHLTRVIYEPMGLGAKVWWVSTRMTLYKICERQGALKFAILERLLRVLLAPFALIRLCSLDESMSGHSMLAEYTKA